MSKPKGTKNKPKEVIDEQLAKLTAIAMDSTQDAETRQAAATALQAALTPTEAEPQQPTAPWPGYMECGCVGDPFADDAPDPCANCRSYLDRERAKYLDRERAKQDAKRSETIDLSKYEDL